MDDMEMQENVPPAAEQEQPEEMVNQGVHNYSTKDRYGVANGPRCIAKT